MSGVRQPCGVCQASVQQPCGVCQASVRQPCGVCQASARQPCGVCQASEAAPVQPFNPTTSPGRCSAVECQLSARLTSFRPFLTHRALLLRIIVRQRAAPSHPPTAQSSTLPIIIPVGLAHSLLVLS